MRIGRNGNKKCKGICFLLLLSLGLAGCEGNEALEPAEVELVDPVLLEETWEAAAYRDLYDAQVLVAAVLPEVTEYAFEVDGGLEQFEAYPGDEVSRGSVLAGLSRERIDEAVEDMEEQIRNMEEDFQKYRQDTEEALAEPEEEAGRLWQIVENLKAQEPEAYEPGIVSGGDMGSGLTQNTGGGSAEDAEGGSIKDASYEEWLEKYENWKKEFTRWEGDYRILAHQNDTVRQQLLQRTELYELDHEYMLHQLEKLRKQREQYLLKASAPGEVVAIGMLENGARVPGGQKLVALGNMSRKMLKCEYVPQSTLSGADDVYALIQGKRYEIRNVPLGNGEYSRLSDRGETIYSTFELENAEEVAIGDFAVIVIMKDSRKNVLSVPADAVSRNGMEYFVTCREGEGSVQKTVIPGKNDGVYTEILSGLEEGDQVLVESSGAILPGTERVTLSKGDFAANFSGNGFFYYPRTYPVTVPVTYGTVYFQEYQVEPYQYVHKGDVIATVRVQRDEVLLQRCQTRLNRLQERLNDLIRQGEEKNEEAIEARREEIADAQEEIAVMNEDFAVRAIVADRNGIVVQLPEHKEEDLLQKGELAAVIAKEDTCYVIVENQGALLHYGNEVTVSYRGGDGQTVSVPGQVANVSKEGVSGDLATDHAFIRVPGEVAGDMTALSASVTDWNSWMRFKVEAVAREMKDVVLVPKEAVWSWRGKTYVMVVDETGRMRAQSFVAGGYDYSYYWVAEGLTEGMVLCLK